MFWWICAIYAAVGLLGTVIALCLVRALGEAEDGTRRSIGRRWKHLGLQFQERQAVRVEYPSSSNRARSAR